jgi:3-phosphoshikimate 1-carboxyvinyltransferase
MKYLRIIKAPPVLNAGITLPASKSISNRLLMIRALSGEDFMISNISNADDTLLMYKAIFNSGDEIYIRNAGTAMRFLTAFFACSEKEVVLQGDERMLQRPISPLVDALRQAGAEIYYLGKDGFPPLQINGKPLKGGKITVNGSMSSQFISALLLTGPQMLNGLELQIAGQHVSWPYVNMTLELMKLYGIKYTIQTYVISVPKQFYKPLNIRVEADWSAGSYFYALAALLSGSSLSFSDLHQESLQGDSQIAVIMQQFGVETAFKDYNAAIKSTDSYPRHFEANMSDTPDLVPTLVSLCCKLKIPFHISGISTLRYKESNRTKSLAEEMTKTGAEIIWNDNEISCFNYTETAKKEIILKTWNDHRLAMSWVLHALNNPDILIENPDVVIKSFPDFWAELKNAGVLFEIFEA